MSARDTNHILKRARISFVNETFDHNCYADLIMPHIMLFRNQGKIEAFSLVASDYCFPVLFYHALNTLK